MSDTAVARSPIHPAPPTTTVAGWHVSARHSDAALQLIDVTPLAKVALRAPAAGATATAVGVSFGHAARDNAGALVIGAGPGDWLALAAPGTADDLAARLHAHCADDEHTTVIDLTHGRAMLRLTGPSAAATLAKLCGTDLADDAAPDGTALRSSVARLATDLVRDDHHGAPSYLLHCERSSGQYLFDAVAAAGDEFGLEVAGFSPPGV